MGIGDWGLGIGDWGLGPIPNPHVKLNDKNYFFNNNLIYSFLNKINLKKQFFL